MFGYQEKTGMSVKQILKMPYIMFVIGMLDAPCIDYEKEDKIIKPKTADDEIAAMMGAFGG